MEHRFITPSDGFIRAIAICRQRLLNCSADTVIGALLNRRVKQNGNVEAGVMQVRINCDYIFGECCKNFKQLLLKLFLTIENIYVDNDIK